MGIYDRDYFQERPGYGHTLSFGMPHLGSMTKKIIIACVVVFLIQVFARPSWLVPIFALEPFSVVRRLYVWQLFTYMFLHGDFWHILMNMLVLYFFGTEIESIFGPRRFLGFYLLCGVVAGLASMVLYYGRNPTILGASGAVLGILAAFATYFPNRIIHLFLFFILPIRIRAKYLALIIAALNLFAASTGERGVANYAHLAGMGVGFLYVKYLQGFAYESPFSRLSRLIRRSRPPRVKIKPPSEEVSDEELDRIIEKVESQGISSLTPEERSFIERLSHKHGL